MVDRAWHKLTQASPELAASCEEMMLAMEWEAERLRGGCESDDQARREMLRMTRRARAALTKAGIPLEEEAVR